MPWNIFSKRRKDASYYPGSNVAQYGDSNDFRPSPPVLPPRQSNVLGYRKSKSYPESTSSSLIVEYGETNDPEIIPYPRSASTLVEDQLNEHNNQKTKTYAESTSSSKWSTLANPGDDIKRHNLLTSADFEQVADSKRIEESPPRAPSNLPVLQVPPPAPTNTPVIRAPPHVPTKQSIFNPPPLPGPATEPVIPHEAGPHEIVYEAGPHPVDDLGGWIKPAFESTTGNEMTKQGSTHEAARQGFPHEVIHRKPVPIR